MSTIYYNIYREKRGHRTVWVIEKVREEVLGYAATYIAEKSTRKAAQVTASLLAGPLGTVIMAKTRREI